MVKITSQWFKSENLTFKYNVNVNKQGYFTTTLPSEIADKLAKAGIDLNINRQYNKGFFSAPTLKELKNMVEGVVKKYSEKELIEEKIILRYAVDTKCHYCLGKDGTIYPDGSFQKRVEGDYNWVEGTKYTSHLNYMPFGFEFFVKPMKVKIWKFPDGEIKKEYSNFGNNDIPEGDDILEWLCSIRGMSSENSSEKEIDYSPEIGRFFKKLMIYVCNLDKNIKKMFGKKFDLSKIDMVQIKQLGFSSKEVDE